MKKYILSCDAELDLIEALDFLEARSQRAAAEMERRLLDAFLYLSEWPGSGHIRDDVPDSNLRFWNVEDYLIIYDPDSVPLNIHAIVHGSRDLGNTLIIR